MSKYLQNQYKITPCGIMLQVSFAICRLEKEPALTCSIELKT